MSHVLDHPVWSALTSRHADIAQGTARARCYPPTIIPFAAAVDDAPESLADLAALVEPGISTMLLRAGGIVVPPGLTVSARGEVVQMVAEAPFAMIDDPRVQPLEAADAADMLDLATLTKPGPFTLKAQALGTFWGIREGGRLIAMAGMRMRQTGYREVSGICTHPDARGRGLGRLMTLFASARIAQGGDTVYLHAYASNSTAIGLYETLGFRIRTTLDVAVVERSD